MGVLNNSVGKGLEAVGLGSVTSRKVRRPSYVGSDFPNGMVITEIIDGRPAEADKIVLAGVFAPHQPFEFGGEQRLTAEYYPGAPEPTVHVLGPKEDETKIRGRLKSKFFKDAEGVDMRLAATEYQELIDAMRIRGNLVRITMGEWRRYGFLKRGFFRLKTLADIDYEIDFFIVGFNPPSNYNITDRANDDVVGPNKELTNAAASQLDDARTFPDEMPQTVSEYLTTQISGVATAINSVTGFVTGIVDDAEQMVASANRAVGLIRYARATISQTARRIGAISNDVSNLGSAFTTEAGKTTATIKNLSHLNKVRGNFGSLAAMLASLQAQFASIAASVPLMRHLVREGDTLQKLSIKYYNTPDNWKKIYDHNKLLSTELTRGAILEIPRL